MAQTQIKVKKQTDLELHLASDESPYAVGVTAAIAAVQSDVDGNEADADSAIAAVQADVDANEAAALSARNAIQADVDANEAASDAAEAALAGRLDVIEGEEEGSIAAAVAVETSRATTAEEELTVKINAEKTRAEAAEAVLTTSVNNLIANSTDSAVDSMKEIVDGHNAAMTILKTVYASKQIQTAQPDGSATEFGFDKLLMMGSPVIYFNGVALEEGFDFSLNKDADTGAAKSFTWLRGEEGEDGEVSIEAPAAGERLMVYGIKYDLALIATLTAPTTTDSTISSSSSSSSTDIGLGDKTETERGESSGLDGDLTLDFEG